MGEYKNQHYVPQFYLKRFSFNGNQKQIGLFNIHRQLFRSNVSIRDQACRSYFYGEDGVIEKFLCSSEGVSATIIRELVSERKIPLMYSKDMVELLFFISLSILRSEVTARNLSEAFSKMVRLVM